MLPGESDASAAQNSAVIRVPGCLLLLTEINVTTLGAGIESSRSQTQGPRVFLAGRSCFSSTHLFILHFRTNPVGS